MSTWQDIRYHGFWDQPRTFCTLGGDQSYLFDCQFDELLDDYPSTYNVYQVPHSDLSDLQALLSTLSSGSLFFLGTLAIPPTAFDPSLRKQIDLQILGQLAEAEDRSGA